MNVQILSLLMFFGVGAQVSAQNQTQPEAGKVFCQFQKAGEPVSFLTWDKAARTLETITGENSLKTTYKDVEVYQGLPPFKNKGFTLVVFGDVPALHLKYTGKATTFDKPCIYNSYESYMGNIPGKLDANPWQQISNREYGTKGVCWTDKLYPYEDKQCLKNHSVGNQTDHGGGNRQNGRDNCENPNGAGYHGRGGK
jgi:hypothetical protein